MHKFPYLCRNIHLKRRLLFDMKKIFFFSLLLVVFQQSNAQPYIDDLWGFRLGQLREVVLKNFGTPFKSGIYTDNYEYDTFLIYNDTSLIITFQYAPDSLRGAYKIESITLKGVCDKIVFQGLKLGDKEEVVQRLIGKPSYRRPTYSLAEKWEYWDSNFTLELYKHKLNSITIRDITLDLYKKYDRSILPKFSKIVNTFVEGNREEMSHLLHPEFEAFPENLRFYFSYPMAEECKSDTSKVFLLTRSPDFGITALRKAKVGEVVEHLKFEKKNPPILIYKCAEKYKIAEIELVYYLGGYRIRKIRYR